MKVTPTGKFTFKVFPPSRNMVEISDEQYNQLKARTACFNSDLTTIVPYTKTAEEIEMDYKRSVVLEIRKRFSVDDELAIHRQRDEKPLEYQTYFDYCEQCKEFVKRGGKIM